MAKARSNRQVLTLVIILKRMTPGTAMRPADWFPCIDWVLSSSLILGKTLQSFRTFRISFSRAKGSDDSLKPFGKPFGREPVFETKGLKRSNCFPSDKETNVKRTPGMSGEYSFAGRAVPRTLPAKWWRCLMDNTQDVLDGIRITRLNPLAEAIELLLPGGEGVWEGGTGAA